MKRLYQTEGNPFKNSVFYVPHAERNERIGIIFLHGAEGGGVPFWKATAQFWAAHGYPSLAYCYFGRSDSLWGPRETLANFELMELYTAMEWLMKSPAVKSGKVLIAGSSRGAELAMLFCSLLATEKELSQPTGVAVHCPSDETYGSWNLDWEDDRCWLVKIPQNPPRGQHPSTASVWNLKCGLDPRHLPPNMRSAWRWKGQEIVPGIKIAVENISIPVFISHGEADDVWSVEKTRRIADRMKLAGRSPEVHYFENEGHNLRGESASRRADLFFDFIRKTVG